MLSRRAFTAATLAGLMGLAVPTMVKANLGETQEVFCQLAHSIGFNYKKKDNAYCTIQCENGVNLYFIEDMATGEIANKEVLFKKFVNLKGQKFYTKDHQYIALANNKLYSLDLANNDYNTGYLCEHTIRS